MSIKNPRAVRILRHGICSRWLLLQSTVHDLGPTCSGEWRRRAVLQCPRSLRRTWNRVRPRLHQFWGSRGSLRNQPERSFERNTVNSHLKLYRSFERTLRMEPLRYGILLSSSLRCAIVSILRICEAFGVLYQVLRGSAPTPPKSDSSAHAEQVCPG